MLREYQARINQNRENIRKSFVEPNDPMAGIKHYTPENLKNYEENLYKSLAEKKITEEEFRKGMEAKNSLIQKSFTDSNGFIKVVFVDAPLETIDLTKSQEDELENDESDENEGGEEEDETELEKGFEDQLQKGGGEGSKGGKVIGHTRSGKPIYAGKSAKDYKGFSAQDHLDASDVHHNVIMDKPIGHFTKKHYREARDDHFKAAQEKHDGKTSLVSSTMDADEVKQHIKSQSALKKDTEKRVGYGSARTKASNVPKNFKDVKSVLMAKTFLQNKYGENFKGSQLTDDEIDHFQNLKSKEAKGFHNYK